MVGVVPGSVGVVVGGGLVTTGGGSVTTGGGLVTTGGVVGVLDAAASVTMTAPSEAGKYELRLHGNYPKKSFNVVQRATINVGGALFAVDKPSAAPGATVRIRFPSPMHSVAGDQYWITIAPAKSADSEWGTWKYVDDGATSVDLTAPAAGEPMYRIDSPEGPFTTNCAYGGADGKQLFITESKSGTVLVADLKVAGRPMYSHT